MKPQSTMEGLGVSGAKGPGNICGQERGFVDMQTPCIHSWK